MDYEKIIKQMIADEAISKEIVEKYCPELTESDDEIMTTIKEKAEEYAKTKHTNQNLIDIVSWDFEAGANYVLEQIEKAYNKDGLVGVLDLIEQLKK